MGNPTIAPPLDSLVLGRLSVMQSVAWGLPRAETVSSFVCRGLCDVPGVEAAHHAAIRGRPVNSLSVRLSLKTGTADLGELVVVLSDPSAFAPYAPYLRNFGVVVAIILEDRALQRSQEGHTSRLEQRVQDGLGKVELLVGSEKILRGQLIEAQKLNAIGRLAGGIAHDFNNMLSVVLGSTELALLDPSASGELRENLSNIRSAAQRSAGLVQQLLAFARQKPIAPRMLDLNEMIESVLSMLKPTLGDNIKVVWAGEADLGCVRMDPSQVDQLMTNLCINARDAIGGVGTISIHTTSAPVDMVQCHGDATPVYGPFVLLTITDTGHGMDADTVSQIFEPFFSTGAKDGSSGLGLATVYGIVKQNGGAIGVVTEVNKGATFSIFLPSVPGVSAGTARPDSKSEGSGRGETLLVVDDDAAVLKVCSRILTSSGYKVMATSIPGEALKLAARHADTVRLLITDVTMPGLNGQDLARQIVGTCPTLKCLFMSGHSSDIVGTGGVLPAGTHFLAKPFTGKDLTTRVRSLLDETATDH